MTITYVFKNNLYVNITNKCSNSCNFCLRNNKGGVGDAKTLWLDKEPTVSEILNDIKSKNLSEFFELVFCGYGEPTYRLNDIILICKEIRKISNIKIRVNTNGLSDLINNRATAKELIGLVDIISISLNASNAQDYQNMCNSKFGLKSFNSIINFAKQAVKYIPKVYLSVVNNNLSHDELEKCEKICNEIGATFKVRSYIK